MGFPKNYRIKMFSGKYPFDQHFPGGYDLFDVKWDII
jgi:hypothetical protein